MSMTENLDRSARGPAGSDGKVPEDRETNQRDNGQADHGLAPDDPLAELIRLVKQEDPFIVDPAQQEPAPSPDPVSQKTTTGVETAQAQPVEAQQNPSTPQTNSTLNIAPLIETPEAASAQEAEPIEQTPVAPANPTAPVINEPMAEAPVVAEHMPRAMAAQVAPAKQNSTPQEAVQPVLSGSQENFAPPVLEVRPPQARSTDRFEPDSLTPSISDHEPTAIPPQNPVAEPAPPVTPVPVASMPEAVGSERTVPELGFPAQTAEVQGDPDLVNSVELEPINLDAALLAARQADNLDEQKFFEPLIEPTFEDASTIDEPLQSEPELGRANYIAEDVASPYEDPAFEEDYTHSFESEYVNPDPVVSDEPQAPSIEPVILGTPRPEPVLEQPRVDPVLDDGISSSSVAQTGSASAPQRRRGAIFAVGLLLGLAVVGGSLAFAFLGEDSNGSDTTPVLRANSDPAKITPDNPGGQAIQHQNRLVYQENGDGTSQSNEQLVPREEQIVGVPKVTPKDSTRPGTSTATLPLPLQPNAAAPVPLGTTPGTTAVSPSSRSAAGVAPAPRRVRTVVVRPDGTVVATEPAPPPGTTDAPPLIGDAPTVPMPSARPAQPQDNQVAQSAPTATQPAPVQNAPTARPAVPASPQNAPIRLAAPNSATQQQIGAAPQAAPATRTAAVPSATQATGSGQFVVQVAARRSEEQAQDAFSALKSQYGSQVGRYGPLVQRADLGDRGVYYRLRIGPMQSQSEAQTVCDNLKSAGLSDCLVRPR